jgi:photosystem II stability/assembly factor-like uncharacterized protein
MSVSGIALLRAQTSLPPAASSGQWKLIGPKPISDGTNHYSGQVSAIAIDPRDSNKIYIGTAAGGVWKSTNGGNTWTPLTDDQPLSAIGSLALDPSNPDVIYAGTGSQFYAGGGILKSTDAGATWTLLPGPFAGPPAAPTALGIYAAGGSGIKSLAVHPTNGNILLAAAQPIGANPATRGVFRSADAGVTWTKVKPLFHTVTVLFHPSDPNIAFAAGVGGIFKSSDAGITWNLLNGSGANTLSIPAKDFGFTLAPVFSKPDTMFASSAGAPEVYRSVDGGAHWTRLKKDPPKDCCGSLLSVSPVNENILFRGAIALCRSTDGGNTWVSAMQGANGAKLHTDMHSAAFTRDGTKFLIGNDGGVWSVAGPATSPLKWTNLNSTLATALFYPNGLAVHPTDPNISIGGTQDNGQLRYGGDISWAHTECGDGGTCVFDFVNPAIAYLTCGNNGHIWKSVAGGKSGSWQEKTAGIDAADMKPEQEALAMDPSDSRRLYFGRTRIFQTNDGAEHWRPISSPANRKVRIITVAPADPNTVWAGGTAGVQVTRNALSPNPTWMNRTTGLPARPVTQIAGDSKDPLTAYVTLSHYAIGNDLPGHVFKTNDGGATWINLSAGLPDVPANDIVLNPDVPRTLYVATEAGVFVSADEGTSWLKLGTGLPRVAVYSLKLVRPARILRAATWGRSAWDLSLAFAGGPRTAGKKEDCLHYNPQSLSIVTANTNGKTSYTVSDGSQLIASYPSLQEATEAIRSMRDFNTVCFEGRGTANGKKWFEKR